MEGRCLPRYVEEEFRRYLPCGLVSEGFTRVKCRDCGNELIGCVEAAPPVAPGPLHCQTTQLNQCCPPPAQLEYTLHISR